MLLDALGPLQHFLGIWMPRKFWRRQQRTTHTTNTLHATLAVSKEHRRFYCNSSTWPTWLMDQLRAYPSGGLQEGGGGASGAIFPRGCRPPGPPPKECHCRGPATFWGCPPGWQPPGNMALEAPPGDPLMDPLTVEIFGHRILLEFLRNSIQCLEIY